MFSRWFQLGLALFVVFLVLPMPVLGGSASDPEIVGHRDSTAQLRGSVIPHLEITKGWIQPEEREDGPDRFKFVLELASLPPLEDLPKDSVYTFHYTLTDIGRFYMRANWTQDHSEFQFFGGMYTGCEPGVCPPFDDQGNRNYLYMPGDNSQQEFIEGQVLAGAPGRITWSFPQEAYAPEERLNGLEMKGLFAATYTTSENRSLRYADTALSVADFEHKIDTPWHQKLFAQIPGPSPLLVAVAVFALLGVVMRRRGPGTDQTKL